MSRYKEDMQELFSKLNRDFHEIITNKPLLRASTEKFLNNLIDELTLGIIFDIHRTAKTKAFDLDDEIEELEIEKGVNIDVFSQYNIKKTQDCVCPYCDRAVAATRFATHLEKCMVKSRQKNVVRKVVINNSTKDNEGSYSGASDDQSDDDWSPGDKRRKKKKERNGKKRSKGNYRHYNEY
ncbi:hypothetical protein WA026_019071 [Henosepilachna vigintioctopunctata]|uniref:SAGA-associated factor 11 n=1 Tax=Henosepilachna vigintioctopunctata TaxID=420089 RepID=A0AAW1VFK3_9CUCU